MKTLFASLCLILALACGGSKHDDPKPPVPPVVTKTAMPQGTYAAKPKAALAMMTAASVQAAPIGTLPQTLIVTPGGLFRFELDNWFHAQGAMLIDSNGQMFVSDDATLTNAEGATVPLILTGQKTGNVLTGTSNGGNFSLELTNVQDQPAELPTKAGTYLSQCSSNGQVMKIAIDTTGHVTGSAYPTTADADADTNKVCIYYGTLSYIDATHQKNCFNIGFQRDNLGGGTFGLAYFTTDGSLIALTANPGNSGVGSGQLSALFSKVQ